MTVMDQIYEECGDKPLVLTITSVFVRVFDGKLCLSTSGATQLLPNLQIHQVVEFIKRINESELVVTRPIYSDPSDLANSAEVTLEALNSAILDVQNKHKYFIVKCTIKCIKDGWCYTGCQLCSKKVEDGVPDYICCNILRTETAKRFRIQMEVADGTSEANLVVLDNLGQVLLGTTATSLFELSDSDSRNPPSVLTKMVDTAIEVQVQVNEYNIQTIRHEFTVTKIIASPSVVTPSTTRVSF
ncbi:hypothetical protein LINGRAPRIM_LOCUS194 [Linum grandiflorum]